MCVGVYIGTSGAVIARVDTYQSLIGSVAYITVAWGPKTSIDALLS